MEHAHSYSFLARSFTGINAAIHAPTGPRSTCKHHNPVLSLHSYASLNQERTGNEENDVWIKWSDRNHAKFAYYTRAFVHKRGVASNFRYGSKLHVHGRKQDAQTPPREQCQINTVIRLKTCGILIDDRSCSPL